MANAAGLIKESIWRDRDFRRLPRLAQCTYCELVSQKDLDRAGMQPLQVAKWAKACEELTEEQVWADLKVLEEHRFVFVDEDTDELFIRSYMRHCELVRYPNILKNALRCAGMVASEKLRHELAKELRRLHRAEAERVADAIDPADYAEPQRNPSETNPKGSETVHEGLNGSGTVREPWGYGTGTGTGSSSVVGHLGRANAENESTPHAPLSIPNDPPPNRCPKHINNPDPPNCRACQAAREACEAWDAARLAAAEQRRRTFLAEVDDCDQCDENGWALDDVGAPLEPAIRCSQHDWSPANA